MEYVKLDDAGNLLAYPYSVQQLRNDNPNTSFPSEMTEEALASWNVFPCSEGTMPQLADDEEAIRDNPVLVDGEWIAIWSVQKISDEEFASKVNAHWIEIRAKRDAKLSATDWTQLPDSPVDKQAWAFYRQQLRDITKQATPFNIAWPQKPE